MLPFESVALMFNVNEASWVPGVTVNTLFTFDTVVPFKDPEVTECDQVISSPSGSVPVAVMTVS